MSNHIVPTLAVGFLGLVAHHCYMDNTYVESAAYELEGTTNKESSSSSIAVVYYSRAGASCAVARAIAKQLQVPLYPIETPSKYALTMSGLYQAVVDRHHPEIRFDRKAILSAKHIKLVIIVCPIWMFQPAPPIWSLVESGVLKDKQVALVSLGTTGEWQLDDKKFEHALDSRERALSLLSTSLEIESKLQVQLSSLSHSTNSLSL